MKYHTNSTSKSVFRKINYLIEETDIRILVFVPPIMAFVGLLIGAFMMNLLSNGHPYRPVTDIMLGILSFFLCFSGYAEIYKKEMPGPLGGIHKGNLAVISGLLIIILSVFLGTVALAHGISTLLQSM